MNKSMKKVTNILMEVLLLVLSLIVLLPFFFAVINSLKTPGEAALLTFSLPKKPMFINYVKVFEVGGVLNGLKNSVMITFITVFFQMLLSSFTAFLLQRRDSRVTEFLYRYIVFGLIPSGFIIPTVFILRALGLFGSYTGLILIYLGSGMPIMILLFTGYMKSIPREIDESTIIDGCKLHRMFFSVIFPQLKPIIATGGIISFMGVWNDFMGPLIYLNRIKKYTLPMTIYNFNSMYNMQWELIFTDLLICAMPIIVVYAFSQKYIISGMTAGAVKG